MSLVAAGALEAALKVARAEVPYEAHDAFASYVLDMEGTQVRPS